MLFFSNTDLADCINTFIVGVPATCCDTPQNICYEKKLKMSKVRTLVGDLSGFSYDLNLDSHCLQPPNKHVASYYCTIRWSPAFCQSAVAHREAGSC